MEEDQIKQLAENIDSLKSIFDKAISFIILLSWSILIISTLSVSLYAFMASAIFVILLSILTYATNDRTEGLSKGQLLIVKFLFIIILSLTFYVLHHSLVYEEIQKQVLYNIYGYIGLI